MTDLEGEVAGYFGRYEPGIARLGRALRAKLRARLPGLYEIVYSYERQQKLVLSYSPIGQGYGGVCSLALSADGVQLYFGQGARLADADPGGLLQGTGKTVRYVVLESVADFGRAGIESLIEAALKLAKIAPVAGAQGTVIMKAESQKKRASRAAKAKNASPARKTPKARR